MTIKKPQKRGPKASVIFGEGIIRSARTRFNLTQEELVEAANDEISVHSVGRAENGHPVSIETAKQLVAILELKGNEIPDKLRENYQTFRTPYGYFRKEGQEWIEYKGEELYARYTEIHANSEHIIIADTKRKLEDGRSMLVRIPAKGGEITWSYENAIVWESFTVGGPHVIQDSAPSKAPSSSGPPTDKSPAHTSADSSVG